MFAIRKHAKALLLLNRSSGRSKQAYEALQEEKEKASSETEIFQVDCDLMSFESVRTAGEEVNKLCSKLGGLTVLMNNAGIMAFPDKRTKDGFDVQLQTNHFSHFLLTKQVFSSLRKAYDSGREVRICQHSSGARNMTKEPIVEKYFERCEEQTLGGDELKAKFQRYHQSKLANTCFAMKLNKELEKRGFDLSKMKSVVAEPGICNTDLINNLITAANSKVYNCLCVFAACFSRNFGKIQSAADGALPLIHASFAKEVESGDFFYPENVKNGKPYKAISKGALVKGNTVEETWTLDEQNQNTVWEKSEEACGPFFEETTEKVVEESTEIKAAQ